MQKIINLRAIAAQLTADVIIKKCSLSAVLPIAQQKLSSKDRALLQEICFGVMRTLPQLQAIIAHLLRRPLAKKRQILHFLLTVGLYQLIYTRIPPHAAISETVAAAHTLGYSNFKGFINGVLREFQRCQKELLSAVENQAHWLHPPWLLARLQNAWPDDWQRIVEQNNLRPPMWLRVNRTHHTRDSWLARLEAEGHTAYSDGEVACALRLATPLGIEQLPGFNCGWVSVQDLSAQRAALLLAPQDDEKILDLCAAPGGKTTHILEIAPKAEVLSVDIDSQRLGKIVDNLERLNMHCRVQLGDGRYPERWCQGEQFDRILIDAPCSATGVIRRHPDIKWLRGDNDIGELAELQRTLLNAIWPYLKCGGTLLYATCSVIPEENHVQIKQFLDEHTDAHSVTLAGGNVNGLQLFPNDKSGDGFFYAKIVKRDQLT